MKRILLWLIISLLALSSIGCSPNQLHQTKVVIAQQFGLGYAPIMIIQKKNLIEKYYEQAEVEWIQVGSGGAIREAIAAGTVDIGGMGVPPFLIAWDKGLNVKAVSALCKMPLGLQTNHQEVKDLKDITADMKIALPSPGSIQHILLSMACEKQLGNPQALDNQIVAMSHPDGVNALINKIEIDAHFTSPPYIFQEIENSEIHQILDGEEDCFGEPFSFLVTICTEEFKNSNPELFLAVTKAIDEAINFINEYPLEASELLADELGISPEEVYKQITWEGVEYSKNPKGMIKFLEYMEKSGYVSNSTDDISELIWENLDASQSN